MLGCEVELRHLPNIRLSRKTLVQSRKTLRELRHLISRLGLAPNGASIGGTGPHERPGGCRQVRGPDLGARSSSGDQPAVSQASAHKPAVQLVPDRGQKSDEGNLAQNLHL